MGRQQKRLSWETSPRGLLGLFEPRPRPGQVGLTQRSRVQQRPEGCPLCKGSAASCWAMVQG